MYQFKSKFFRRFSAGCLTVALAATTAFADTIRLKDGSIIKGKIVSFGGGKFIVQIGSRQLDFSAAEVESIQFDAPSGVANSNAAAKPPVVTTDKNSTVIAVGQNPKPNASPVPAARPANQQTTTTTTSAAAKPIEINVKVTGDNTSNGWSNSGWVVSKGQRIRITGTGRVSLGGGRYTTPGGIASLSDKDKLMARESTGGLIAVIGDNNNDFIFIGETREFVATRDGALFLGVNEGNLDDNSGVFDVKIEITPDSGS